MFMGAPTTGGTDKMSMSADVFGSFEPARTSSPRPSPPRSAGSRGPGAGGSGDAPMLSLLLLEELVELRDGFYGRLF